MKEIELLGREQLTAMPRSVLVPMQRSLPIVQAECEAPSGEEQEPLASQAATVRRASPQEAPITTTWGGSSASSTQAVVWMPDGAVEVVASPGPPGPSPVEDIPPPDEPQPVIAMAMTRAASTSLRDPAVRIVRPT
jgi:hypothetical protein